MKLLIVSRYDRSARAINTIIKYVRAGKALGHQPREREQAAGDKRRHAQGRLARGRLPHVAQGDVQHLGWTTRIDAGKVTPQRELIAEQRGHRVGVGVAADVAQQRLIVDVAQRVVVQAKRLAQSHRHHAGAERRIQRLAHAQIGGNG